MSDPVRVTQAVIEVDVANAPGQMRVTQAAVQVDVTNAPGQMRVTQAVIQVDVKQPYPGINSEFGPLVQILS